MHSYKTIRELHDAFDAGKTTPTELTKYFFSKIDESKHNAWITLCKDRALKQAEVLTQELKAKGKTPRAEKPLFGIPLGIKDLLTIEDVRTTAGSKMLDNYVAPYTATAILKLEKA